MITEAEALVFLKAYESASNTHDFFNVADMIHPEALYRFTDGNFKGLEAIRAGFEKTWAFEVAEERYWLSNVKLIYADENSALLTYDFHWAGVGSNGPFQANGRGAQLLVRNGDKLQSIYEHLSR